MPRENSDIPLSDIYVLDGRVRVNQPESGGLRTSLDSVMLASACPAKEGDHILDLGCGVGAAGLCVLARVTETCLTGVDIMPELIELAVGNTTTNGWADRAQFIGADVLAPDFSLADAPFNHVICNPPYLDAGTYTRSPDDMRAAALGHGNDNQNLENWLRVAHRFLKSRGSLTVIHRADYLDQILNALGRRFGAVEIIPLWPRTGQAAKRVIVRAIKDRRGGLILHAGIALHDDAGWTVSAQQILNDMAAI